MPVETTGKAVDKLEKGFLGALNNEQPMKLPIEILEKKYELELSGIVDKFEEICKHFKGKKIAKTTSLSTLAASSESLGDAKYINETVKPFITTIKKKFGFNDETTLENFCQYIINVLKGMTDVFDLNLTSTINKIKKAYKEMTNNDPPEINLDVSSVSETVKLFSKAQTLIDIALEKHDWGSSDLQKDGDFKDKTYNDLKVSLGILNTKYQELKVEGNIAYTKISGDIVDLYKQIKTFDHLGLDNEFHKAELDKKVANLENMQKGVQCDPCDTIKKFLKEVRALEKESHKNNAGLVIITQKDACRRRDLLQGKHLGKIQITFFAELLKNNGFKGTLDLINTNLLRSQRLEAQLRSLVSDNRQTIDKLTFNTAVNTYFKEIQDKLTDINAKSNIDISFTQLKENIDQTNSNWDISKDVVYCIGYIYIQLSDFVKFLTTNMEIVTNMLKEANGTLKNKDASKFKFGMDVYVKLANVAGFIGPLVASVCPIFAAIWGAVALSGTIVQIVQVVYNRHEAKKTAEAKALEPKKSEESAEPDDKQEKDEKPDDTIEEKEKVDTKTTNADVEKLKKKISDLKTLKKALTSQNKQLISENKKLISENENYKKRVKELEAKLAKLESENA